jgi:hypothetical protein
VALALLAACLISSCGGSTNSEQPTTSSARPKPPTVGQSVRVPAGGTALVVTVRRVIFPLRGSGALLTPGDRAAGVEVTVRNAGHNPYDSSSESDVGLRTNAGQQADTAFASVGHAQQPRSIS